MEQMVGQGGPESPHPTKGNTSGQPPRPIPTSRGKVCRHICYQTKTVYKTHALISGMQICEQNNRGFVVTRRYGLGLRSTCVAKGELFASQRISHLLIV